MTNRALRRRAGRASVALALTSILGLAVAGPALADTSQATAQAATLVLLGQPTLSTGQVVASNDGTSQTKTGTTAPALSLLGGVGALSTGALFQDAVANSNGTSAACAGVVGPNGTVQIGPAASCVVSQNPGGVVINLGLVVIRADAITAGCAASSNGTTSTTVTLVNARVTDPTGAVTLLSLPVNPAPGTGLNVAGVAGLTLNDQSSSAPGQVSVTALHLTLLSGVSAGQELRLGTVTCGRNALTAPTSLVPAAGLPAAGATILAGAVLFWFVRRRSSSTPTDA